MGLEVLASSVISILIPYISAGAKKAAEVAGEAAAKTAGELLSSLKRWFAGDEEAEEVLVNFEKRPSLYGEAMDPSCRRRRRRRPKCRANSRRSSRRGARPWTSFRICRNWLVRRSASISRNGRRSAPESRRRSTTSRPAANSRGSGTSILNRVDGSCLSSAGVRAGGRKFWGADDELHVATLAAWASEAACPLLRA